MNDWIGSIAPTQKLLQHSRIEIHKKTVCLALTYFNGNINVFFTTISVFGENKNKGGR